MSKEIFLSKSLYLNGLQCKKYLWLKKYNEKKLQKPDASQEAIFKTGDAVGEKAEVWMDSGIRSGQDVLRAIALGAQGTLVGRAFLYGLGANGQAGVTQ